MCPLGGGKFEPEASREYSIAEVNWFDLCDESTWDPELRKDPFTYPLVQRVRDVLGYLSMDGPSQI